MTFFQRLKEYVKGDFDVQTEFSLPGEVIRFGVEQIHPCLKLLKIHHVTMTVTKVYHNPLFAPTSEVRHQLEGRLTLWDGQVFIHRTITDYPLNDGIEVATLATVVECLKMVRDQVGEITLVS